MSVANGSNIERSKAVTEALSFVPPELIRVISEYAVVELSEFWDANILPLLSRCDIFPVGWVSAYNSREEIDPGDDTSWITGYHLGEYRVRSGPDEPWERWYPALAWHSATCTQLVERLAIFPRRKLFSELPAPKSLVWFGFDKSPLPPEIQTVLDSVQKQLEVAVSGYALELEFASTKIGSSFRFVNKSNKSNQPNEWIGIRINQSVVHSDGFYTHSFAR